VKHEGKKYVPMCAMGKGLPCEDSASTRVGRAHATLSSARCRGRPPRQGRGGTSFRAGRSFDRAVRHTYFCVFYASRRSGSEA